MNILKLSLKKIKENINHKNIVVSVVGLGRIGLSLSLLFACNGIKTFGIDVSAKKIRELKKKKVYFREPKIKKLLKDSLNITFFPTRNFNVILESDVSYICINTPMSFNRYVPLRNIKKAIKSIGKILRKKKETHLIVIKSTLPIGATEKMIKPLLEKYSHKKVNKDIGLVVSPEFAREGYIVNDLQKIRKVIGGCSLKSSKIAALIESIIGKKVYIMNNTKEAETVKLFSNYYLYSKFSLANEFGILCKKLGISYFRIKNILCKDKRIQLGFVSPIGGPCLPKDLWLLNYTFPNFWPIKIRFWINQKIKREIIKNTIKIIRKNFNPNAKIGIYGLAFKENTDDTTNSIGAEIVEALKNLGYQVISYDPLSTSLSFVKKVSEKNVLNSDCLILWHSLHPSKFKKIKSKVVIDIKSNLWIKSRCFKFYHCV